MHWLTQQPIITKADIKKRLGCNDEYAYTVLNRLKEKNKLIQIHKGVYTAIEDIHLIATNIHVPSYISFWSASQLKGYTEQILLSIQVATTKQYKTITHNQYKIEFYQLPKKAFFGYTKQQTTTGSFFIAEDEKLIIDCLLRENTIGNTQEIISIIKQANINKQKMITYLNRINNKTLNKKAGFLLEKYANTDLSEHITYKDSNYAKIGLNEQIINAKWRIKHDLT
ncbi:MAG: type IV toxin-antitoxin system AbiEi family antitoxin domain-containing protein [Candidatus Woesearchaeota archaeon]